MTKALAIDACSLLNLMATGQEKAIVRAHNARLLVTPGVKAEAQYLVGPADDDGQPTRERVDHAELEAGGLLEVVDFSDAALAAFVRAAEVLTDVDAQAVALARTRGIALVSDDLKVRRVTGRLFPDVEVLSILELVHDAVSVLGLSDEAVRSCLQRLAYRGNFAPSPRLPLYSWFKDAIADGA